MPDDLTTLANAYSVQISAANRYWLACALLTFTILGHAPDEAEIKAFGVGIASNRAMPLLVLFLSVANIVYCSAHIQTYKAADVFRKFISDCKLSKTQEEIAHLLCVPHINRLAPFNHALVERYRWSELFDAIKTVFDLLLLIVPVFGVLYSVSVVEFPLDQSSSISALDAVYISLLFVSVPSSLVASLFLGLMVVRRQPR